MPFCLGVEGGICKGYSYNQSGTKQVYLCTKCDRKFTPDDGFWKMKNTPETVSEALDLYVAGHSLAGAKSHLWKHHGIHISETSIRNWVKKYSRMISRYTETLPVKEDQRIHEDEVELKVNGKKTYFWRAKGSKTGFKFSGPVGRRNMANCQQLNRQIKKRCYKHMLERKKAGKKKVRFVSDKLPHYKTTHNKMFRNTTALTHGVPIKGKIKGLKYNNNVIECEHPSVNARVRLMKGVEDNDFVEAVLYLNDNFDNFTRKRNRKIKTPAEFAGISLDLGRNTTLGLIYFLRLLGLEEFMES